MPTDALPFSRKPSGEAVSAVEASNSPSQATEVAGIKHIADGPEAPMEELPPSTYEEGGWRPWADHRDASGLTFAEWSVNCAKVAAGQEPLKPSQPRHHGLYAPNPDRRQPVAKAPEARKKTPATAPNGERVIVHRLDAYARRPSRKTRVKKGESQNARYIRAADIRVMEELNSWGFLDRDQLSALLGLASNSLVRRLNKLVSLGMLDRSHGYNGKSVYAVTEAGRRLIQADRFRPLPMSLSRHDHRDAQAAVGAWVQRMNPSGVVVTERELQRAGYDLDGRVGAGGDLGPRLKRLAPWLIEQTHGDYSVWTPVVRDPAGREKGHHRPDLLLVQRGQLPVVIEIELNEKARKADLRDTVRAFSDAQAAGHIGQVVYLASEESSLSVKRLRALLDRAVQDAGVSVDVRVVAIPPEVWRPTAARLRSA